MGSATATGPELLPAIDIRGGSAVRLLQGDYDRETHYGDDPVGQQFADGVREPGAHATPEVGDAPVDPVDRRGGQGEDRLEQREHHADEHERPGDRVQQHGIDAPGARVGAEVQVLVARGAREHALDPPRPLEGPLGRCHQRARPPIRTGQQMAHGVEADATVTDDTDDGDAERERQQIEVESTAASREFVDHGEHHAGRPVEPQHLGHEEQRTFEGGGIGHHHDRVRWIDPLDASVERIRDHGLVGADRVERVGAGEVDEGDGVVADGHVGLAAGDGHPRVVRRLGP